MKIIMRLVELIDEELGDAKKYIKMASREREAHPQLAVTFAELADQEMTHVKMLHTEATRLIEEYRTKVGEPPADMLAVYNYEHNKQVDRAAKIRQMIAEYRS